MVPAPADDAAGAAGDARSEHATTKWRPAFEAVLKAIVRDYAGQEEKIREGMASGMRKLFENPYEAELSALPAARRPRGDDAGGRLGVEDAQRVIFFPRLSDMQYYVDALALDTPEKTKRREKLMKIKMVSVFYTLHRRDGALVDRFMHCGGLQSLVELVADENPVIQSEAVELLMEMLSPQMQLGPIASSARQAHLIHQIWRCLRSRPFWTNFARIIAEPAERFPNSHEHSVRIIAGAVGWLRPDEDRMPEAVAPPDVSEAAAALQAYLDSGVGIRPDIRGVAEDLMAELLDVPRVREDPLRGPELQEAKEGLFDAASMAREDAAHAWQALRRLGNEAFKAGLVWPAEAAYVLALAEGGAVVPDAEAAVISSNRALVLLKAGHPADAVIAAAEALRRDPRNAKAAFRRAQGLLEHLAAGAGAGAGAASKGGKGAKAAASAAAQVRQAAAAVEAAELAARLEPKDAKVAELLQRARGRLEELTAAAEAAAERAQGEPASPESPTAKEAEAVENDAGAPLDEMD